MRAKDPRDEAFVYYLSRHPDFRAYAIRHMSGTSGRQRVAWQALTDFEIEALDPGTRHAVGETLSALDDKIELNRRMNETLEASARALFRDWFVHFGPTRAKAEGRPAYLALGLWSLFPDRLDDDGVPEGWTKGRLDDLVEVAPREQLKRGVVAPYLDMAALPTTGSSSRPAIDRQYSSGTRFRSGDTLLARITPCLENGKTAFIQHLPDDTVGWGSTEFIVLRSKSPVPEAVSYLVARDEEFRRYAIQSMSGTSGRQRANADAIAGYPVSIPDGDRLWGALAMALQPVFEQIALNDSESHTLAETREAEGLAA